MLRASFKPSKTSVTLSLSLKNLYAPDVQSPSKGLPALTLSTYTFVVRDWVLSGLYPAAATISPDWSISNRAVPAVKNL